jgi:TonB family protein
MKRLLAPLLALAFVAGAGVATAKPARPLSPEDLGMRTTAWGVLPTYNISGQRFTFKRFPRATLFPDERSVTLDVLINADGSVEDATITTGSGDSAADVAALSSFIGARYSLQPGENYPTPFVVRQKMTFGKEIPFFPNQQFWGPQSSLPPPGAPYYQTWYGAGGGWSGGGSYSNSSSGK